MAFGLEFGLWTLLVLVSGFVVWSIASGRELGTRPDSGIGGWLLLPALALICAPFRIGSSIYLNLDYLKDVLPPNLRVAVLIETILLAAMMLFAVYVAIAFFRRRTGAPRLMIALLIAGILFNGFGYVVVTSILRQNPQVGGLLASLVAAAVWIPYFLLSKRVKATFVCHGATGDGSNPASSAPSAPGDQETDRDPSPSPTILNPSGCMRGVLDSGKEPCAMAEERITASPVVGPISPSDAEWFVIHAGNELGPMSLAELVEKAVAAAIMADDLVKQSCGLWTKARDFGFLQQEFLLKEHRENVLKQLGRFHGIWISKKALVIGGCLFTGLIGFSVLWVIVRATNTAREAEEPSKEALVYFERGIDWWAKKNYDKAIENYTQAIRLDPKNANAFAERGNTWSDKKDYDKAIRDYDEAIRLNPNSAFFYHNRGFAWWGKKDYDKAIRDYDEAIRLNPSDAYAYNNRGNAWSAEKEYDIAIKDYNEAIRLDPNDAFPFNGRGIAWTEKKHYDEAIKDFNEAIRLDPNYESAFNNRAIALSRKKDRR